LIPVQPACFKPRSAASRIWASAGSLRVSRKCR
jgi:hypothetical protein